MALVVFEEHTEVLLLVSCTYCSIFLIIVFDIVFRHNVKHIVQAKGAQAVFYGCAAFRRPLRILQDLKLHLQHGHRVVSYQFDLLRHH